MNTLPELYSIGSISGKHGFKGAVILRFTEPEYTKILKKGTWLFISIEGKGVPFFIEQVLFEGCFQLEGVNSEDAAIELAGKEIMVEQSRVKSPKQALSITGFKIYDPAENFLGIIQRIETYPAGEMLFVENTDGEEWMLPLAEDWITEVKKTKKIIVMQIPDGLMQINNKTEGEEEERDDED